MSWTLPAPLFPIPVNPRPGALQCPPPLVDNCPRTQHHPTLARNCHAAYQVWNLHHAVSRPRQAVGAMLRRGHGARHPRRRVGLRRVLDRRAPYHGVREHNHAGAVHRRRNAADEEHPHGPRPRMPPAAPSAPRGEQTGHARPPVQGPPRPLLRARQRLHRHGDSRYRAEGTPQRWSPSRPT